MCNKISEEVQVFSQRVAATVNFLARNKALPEECRGTAIFINVMDQVFDSFNGSKYKDDAKPLKGRPRRKCAFKEVRI
ncbi:unnamed protein product [Parnassius apollo]|uniref:(apollo) hypothetical protein n=1 Tax=Parnassius apollo TaxID=110799 RepID=A0A8S3XIP6_PARAO|nr:unnamed protein product [Parnassius apollo]